MPRRANVVGHLLTFRPGELMEYDGVRLTSPARTWLDLASMASVDELVIVGDSLVCSHGREFPAPREPLCTEAELRAMVADHPGIRGIRAARTALELIRVGADSQPETMMRLALVRAGLPEPELNHVLWGLEVRVSKDDLTGGVPAVVRKVRAALESRGWRPR